MVVSVVLFSQHLALRRCRECEICTIVLDVRRIEHCRVITVLKSTQHEIMATTYLGNPHLFFACTLFQHCTVVVMGGRVGSQTLIYSAHNPEHSVN